MSLAQELSRIHEQLQGLSWDLIPVHEKSDLDTAAQIREIMAALIEQEKALASLVEKLEMADWGCQRGCSAGGPFRRLP